MDNENFIGFIPLFTSFFRKSVDEKAFNLGMENL